jgi:hypothetical protein
MTNWTYFLIEERGSFISCGMEQRGRVRASYKWPLSRPAANAG